jgi:hydroxymethylpyrimidine/phosphomethylpyrimidine kinase
MTVAGSDSGGGAGIQADLKTFAALGVHGTSTITALTAQNTLGVADIFDLPPTFVEAQFDAIASDIGVDAMKTGMLFSAPIIHAVCGKIRQYGLSNVVVDPVMVATSGDEAFLREFDAALGAPRVQPLRALDALTPAADVSGRR